jgi:hypothetical protein
MSCAKRRTRIDAIGGALACCLVLVLAGAAVAEVRRIEEVGVVPLGSGGSGLGAARDAAKQAGLRAAVERVAQSFLMEVDGGEGVEDVDLEKILGQRMVPYTTRFRVLEDQGERPAMFPGKSGGKEYVVVVEVFVDADRVRQRLVDAGLLEDPLAGGSAHVELELRGVRDYAALAAVRELLTERFGAVAAVPLRFERGLVVLDVELEGRAGDAAELADQMVSRGGPGLGFQAISADAKRAVLGVTWSPPTPADRQGSRDASG